MLRHRSGPLKADRSSTGDGWKYAEELNTAKLHETGTSFGSVTTHEDISMNAHDGELNMNTTLSVDALESLEHATEGDVPSVSLVAESARAQIPEAEDSDFVYDDGTTVDVETGEMDLSDSDSDAGSVVSSLGSEWDSDEGEEDQASGDK